MSSHNPFYAAAHDSDGQLRTDWHAWAGVPTHADPAFAALELDNFLSRARALLANDVEREVTAWRDEHMPIAVFTRSRASSPSAGAAAAAAALATPFSEYTELFRRVLVARNRGRPDDAARLCGTLRERYSALARPYASDGDLPFKPDAAFPEVSGQFAEYIAATEMLALACDDVHPVDVRRHGIRAGWPLGARAVCPRVVSKQTLAQLSAIARGGSVNQLVFLAFVPSIARVFQHASEQDWQLLTLYLFPSLVQADESMRDRLDGLHTMSPLVLEALAGAAAQVVLGYAQFAVPDLRPVANTPGDAFECAYVDAMIRHWTPGLCTANFFRWGGTLPTWTELRRGAANIYPPEVVYAMASAKAAP